MHNIHETNMRLTGTLCDKNGKLKISSVIERFVDLTDEQTKQWEKFISLDNDNSGVCWIINKYDIKIYSFPEYLSQVKLRTYQSRYTKHFCERVFAVYDTDDNLLMRILSYWSLRDFEAMRIVSVPEEYARFTYTENTTEKSSKKMSRNTEYTHSCHIYVRRDDFDANMHVNNAKYLSFLYECDDIMDYEKYELSEVLMNFIGGINNKDGNTMLYSLYETDGGVKLCQKIICSDGTTAAQSESYWRQI